MAKEYAKNEGAKKANAHKLTPLSKAQIVSGFKMGAEFGTVVTDPYDGHFVFTGAINIKNKSVVLKFLQDEGFHPVETTKGTKRILLPAHEYYELEKRHSIPLGPKDVEQMLRRFHEGDYSSQFTNHNSAFGPSFTRAMKLLRDNGIAFTSMTDNHKCMLSEELHEGTITLTPESYAKLQANMKDILAAEKTRYDAHQAAITAKFGPLQG